VIFDIIILKKTEKETGDTPNLTFKRCRIYSTTWSKKKGYTPSSAQDVDSSRKKLNRKVRAVTEITGNQDFLISIRDQLHSKTDLRNYAIYCALLAPKNWPVIQKAIIAIWVCTKFFHPPQRKRFLKTPKVGSNYLS